MGILDSPSVMALVIKECGEPLVALQAGAPFLLEPMYYKWQHSRSPFIELRSGVLKKLEEALRILRSKPGCEAWNFKIWDGYRTLEVQKSLYFEYLNKLKFENPDWDDFKLNAETQVFVSFHLNGPELPPPHNTGAAVDLTIVDAHGREIDMGTAFDEFVDAANTMHFVGSTNHRDKSINKNRALLIEVMQDAGFVNYESEWWHFSYGDQFWASKSGALEAIYGSMEL